MAGAPTFTEPLAGDDLSPDANQRATCGVGVAARASTPPFIFDTDRDEWADSLNDAGSDRSKWLCPAAPVSMPFHSPEIDRA